MEGNYGNSWQQLAVWSAVVADPEDILEVRAISGAHDVRKMFLSAHALRNVAEQLTDWNANGFGIYAGINPRRQIGASGDSGVKLARVAFADFDHTTVERALTIVRAKGLPDPAMAVCSGWGCHVYWRFPFPSTDLTAWRELQKDLAGLLGSDCTVHNPERVARLGGFFNLKREPVPCFIASADATRRVDLRPLVPFRPTERRAVPTVQLFRSPDVGNARDPLRRCLAYVAKLPPAISGSGGHDATLRAACECFRFGLDDADAWHVMQAFNASQTGGEPWTDQEVRHKLASARRKVEAKGEHGVRLRDRHHFKGRAMREPAPAFSLTPLVPRTAVLA